MSQVVNALDVLLRQQRISARIERTKRHLDFLLRSEQLAKDELQELGYIGNNSKVLRIDMIYYIIKKLFNISKDQILAKNSEVQVIDCRRYIVAALFENGLTKEEISNIIKRKPREIGTLFESHKKFLKYYAEYRDSYSIFKNNLI